jgi:putative membrane protein
MKRFLTILLTVLFFVTAVVLGLKNQQVVTLDFLIAQSELRLSTLLAIVFSIGFSVAILLLSYFYLKIKMENRRLRKLNEKQRKSINELRANSEKE